MAALCQWSHSVLIFASLVALFRQCSSGASAPSGHLNCLACVYYAHIAMPMNSPQCASGRGVKLEPCANGHSCKVTFLQDSNGTMVHAARSCQSSQASRQQLPDLVSLVFNARTTMYCNTTGCNNNWQGRGAPEAGQPLRCWVGHGRRIDKFKLQACSSKVLELATASGNTTGGGSRLVQMQTPVCLLAQLTRQITYNGRAYESAMYLADCVPHASSVYGRNYPMFEYERVCKTPGCNSGPAALKLERGVLTAGFTFGVGNRAASRQAGWATHGWLAVTMAAAALATAELAH